MVVAYHCSVVVHWTNLICIHLGMVLPGSNDQSGHRHFDTCFSQSMEKVSLPPGHQRFDFGWSSNQSMKSSASLPFSFESVTFGVHRSQSIEKARLPPGFQRFTFGWSFNQSVEGVSLLHCFRASLLVFSLQSIIFGVHCRFVVFSSVL